MIKYLYKGIILLGIFIGALFYFGRDIKEEVFDMNKTIEMGSATFPTLTLRLNGEEMNLLHGYSNNLEAGTMRESITPLSEDQSLEVVVDGKENDVKRVLYELRSVTDNHLLEDGTINALEKEKDFKAAKIKFKTEMQEGLEYAVNLTLVTSESRKMNYYTRVERIPSSYYKEKLKFIMDFHNSIMDKKKAESIIDYLEPEAGADNTSFSYVNIHSSFELISWGSLKPEVLGTIVPTIKEISADTASVELKYMISAKTESGQETYYVKEYYRVRYTSSRMYLLNYERTMDSAFDLGLTSLKKSEFKLGITNQTDTNLLTNKDNTKMCFVSQRELWYYSLAENKAVKVFSFRQKDSDYVRDNYDEHNVKILNMDDDGNVNFIVYGYMNRGVYEGRVGIVLYKYYSGEDRIEELVYIPVNVPYQILKEELGQFSYVNQLNVFYFTLGDKIYAYNLTTKGLKVIASNITSDDFVISKEQHYIAWQNDKDPKKASEITLLDLESGKKLKITAPSGNNINLLGKIDNNIIYGYVRAGDITTDIDGSTLVPMYKILIADKSSKILKEYVKRGYYVTGIKVEDNIITLIRNKKDGRNRYVLAKEDYILNKVTEETKAIGLTTRVTNKMLTEYYISLPAGFIMEKKPDYNSTINTIITEDTTLRLEDADKITKPYIVYAQGGVAGLYEAAGSAINQADALAGTVHNNRQQTIWERGIRSNLKELTITPVYTSGNIDSVKACVTMLLNYKSGSSGSINVKDGTLYEMLKQGLGDLSLNLSGCTLEEVLYYVNKNRPVIAMSDKDNAVLIVGFDMYNITVIDPKGHIKKKIGLNDSTEMFKNAGNLFFSYTDKNDR